MFLFLQTSTLYRALASAFKSLCSLQEFTLEIPSSSQDDDVQLNAVAGWICVASALPHLSSSLHTLSLLSNFLREVSEEMFPSSASVLPLLPNCDLCISFSSRVPARLWNYLQPSFLSFLLLTFSGLMLYLMRMRVKFFVIFVWHSRSAIFDV